MPILDQMVLEQKTEVRIILLLLYSLLFIGVIKYLKMQILDQIALKHKHEFKYLYNVHSKPNVGGINTCILFKNAYFGPNVAGK